MQMLKLTGLYRFGRLGILCAALVAAIAPGLAVADIANFHERVYHDASGDHKYMLFVPTGYTPERKWPLIVFLHGAGSRGTDNRLSLVGGLAPIARERAATFPFLAVFPQCEDTESRLFMGWNADTADGQRVFKILDQVERDFSVDRTHEILTGGSMGGCGTWSLLAAHPERFSAAIVIAGDCDPAFASKLAKVPVWVFHGQNDVAIPIEKVRQLVASIREAGGRVNLTELPGQQHNIGYLIFSDNAIYEWMLDPQSELRPQGILSQCGRPQNEADMGREEVQPFVPAVEVPQAVLVRLDREAMESLLEAVPGLIPPGAVAGNGENIHQSKRAFLMRLDVALSDIQYSGTVEQLYLTPDHEGWLTMDVGLRNLTLEVGAAQVKGGLLSATAGPMDVVIGHNAPVWLRLRVRPYIAERKIRFELGGTDFQIPDDNWYVTAPQVEVRGLYFTRNRVASAMVTSAYGRKAEIEAQVAAAGPTLVHKVEELLEKRFSTPTTLGQVPMPAYQPRYLVWPNKLRVDEFGLAIVFGMTFSLPGLPTGRPELRRFEQPEVDLAQLPRPRGIEVGVSRATTEGLTAAIFATGQATVDVRDIPIKTYARLGEPSHILEAVPDLARFGDKLQVRAQLHYCEPMSVGSAWDTTNQPNGKRSLPPNNRLLLEVNKSELRIDYRLSSGAPWRHCAVFDVHLAQEFQFDLDRLNFGTRVIHVANPTNTEILATGRFAPGYEPIDRTLDSERVADLTGEAWGGCQNATGGRGIPFADRKVGSALFRLEEICCIDDFMVFRRLPAATRITNRSPEPLTYSVRIARSEWSPFYTLAPGKSHDFHTTSPLMFRTATAADEAIKTLPMGTCFAYGDTNAPRGQVAAVSRASVSVER
jgi:poly(3-hydroxybutyrate) depolymerase